MEKIKAVAAEGGLRPFIVSAIRKAIAGNGSCFICPIDAIFGIPHGAVGPCVCEDISGGLAPFFGNVDGVIERRIDEISPIDRDEFSVQPDIGDCSLRKACAGAPGFVAEPGPVGAGETGGLGRFLTDAVGSIEPAEVAVVGRVGDKCHLSIDFTALRELRFAEACCACCACCA